MFVWIYLIGLSVASDGIAQSKFLLKSIQKSDSKIIELDLNQDKKVDRRETYSKGQLVKVEYDRAFKGILNETIVYQPLVDAFVPISIRYLDTNYDKKVDREEETFRDIKAKQEIVVTRLSSKLDGNFDRKWLTRHPLFQEQESNPCVSDLGLPDLSNLLNPALTNVDVANNFTTTGSGHQIHQSCFENWGRENFSQAVNESFSNGRQCLEQLSRRPTSLMNRAYQYQMELNQIWENDSVKISCEPTPRNWTGIAGFASTDPGQVMPGTIHEHPFISINPSDPNPRPASEAVLKELKNTLFHEQFHNLGLKHGLDIEAPYACAACCISSRYSEAGEDDKELACKVCVGDYSGPQDQNYVRDMIAWSDVSYSSLRRDIPHRIAIEYLQANPGSRWGVIAFAESMGGPETPVGSRIAATIEETIPRAQLSSEEKEMIKRARRYENFIPEWNLFSNTTNLTAQAFIMVYLKNDREGAIALLQANQDAILTEIEPERSGGAASYTRTGVRDGLRRIIDVLTPADYPPSEDYDYRATMLWDYWNLRDK